MHIKDFITTINRDFYVGVPDSQLKSLCDYLMKTYGISQKHLIGVNEGNCTALAAGYYLSTGKVPVVYLQNSGIGNIINPVASLLHEKVYGIPCIFIVGWRGEPGKKDEPQHVFQGEVTITLLKDIGLTIFIMDSNTTIREMQEKMVEFDTILKQGKSVAIVVKSGAFESKEQIEYHNNNVLSREQIISEIIEAAGEDLIISTTGKTSRELFELREMCQQSHQSDFLTVGSMGHSSSIALGIALQKPDRRVWCIDGDGAMLMHMGAMALIGANKPDNLVHVVINNYSHETVGGMPTVSEKINLTQIALGCGYPKALLIENLDELYRGLKYAVSHRELLFMEVKAAIGSRKELGRPTISSQENMKNFMNYLIE